MLRSSLFSLVCLILSAHSFPLILPDIGSSPSLPALPASPPPTNLPPFESIQFTLHPIQHPNEPELEGPVSWMYPEVIGPQTIGGPLGWFYNSKDPTNSIPADRRKELVAFVQYGAESGIVFDSTKSSRQVYVAPGNPGQMILGPEPSDAHQYNSEFTVTKKGDKYLFGVKGEGDGDSYFMYCKTQGGSLLYFGTQLGPNCAPLQGLEAKFKVPRNSAA